MICVLEDWRKHKRVESAGGIFLSSHPKSAGKLCQTEHWLSLLFIQTPSRTSLPCNAKWMRKNKAVLHVPASSWRPGYIKNE